MITFYWNGEKIATGYIPNMKDTPFPLLLGRRYDSRGHFHNGLFDEVVLFDRALSATEIQAIFSAGSAGICKGAHHPSYAISGTVTSDRAAHVARRRHFGQWGSQGGDRSQWHLLD